MSALDRVKRVVKVLGLVNCVDGFTASPQVINGFSDCMVEIFGEAGRHGRSAFGVSELPAGIPVEVETISNSSKADHGERHEKTREQECRQHGGDGGSGRGIDAVHRCCGGEVTIRIGLIQPVTGPTAYDGQSVIDGARLAASEINAAGGVLDRKIEVLLQDGKSDPAESLSAAEKLLDRDKVRVLIGAWASSATLAVMPLVQRYEVPLIVEMSTAEKITEMGNPWVFRISSNSKIDANALQPYLVKKLGFHKVAFMAANNDFGRAVVTNWSRVLTPQGATVVATEYHKPGETNFSPTLTKIKNSGADTIVITSDVTTASNIIKQSYELGMTGFNRVIASGDPAEAIIKLAGKEASEGMLVQNYWVP